MHEADEKFYNKPEATPEFLEFYERLGTMHAAPLWEALAELVPVRPRPRAIPALWHYDEIRPFVMESGKLITAEQAERRVLILANPGIRDSSQITDTLYAGLQLILPGEIAPTHRHTTAALRFIIEGTGAYTAVDGVRTTMNPGDFIVTPSWTFHDHGNTSDTPTIWMDGLDIPLVNMFNTGFAEHHPDRIQAVTNSGSGSGRVFNYSYSRTRELLDELYRNGPLHPAHGVKWQYVDQATGEYPLRAIAAFLQLLPAGFKGKPHRCTDATVYCVVEGRGRTQIGENIFDWKEHDIFVAPSWYPVSHESKGDAVLFSYSDRPAQQALGIWRESS